MRRVNRKPIRKRVMASVKKADLLVDLVFHRRQAKPERKKQHRNLLTTVS